MSDRPAKRKFYKTLVRLLGESPGVRPADVFVMMTITRPGNFSFADGVIVTDIAAAEPLDLAAQTPGTTAGSPAFSSTPAPPPSGRPRPE
ncbi:MAG: tautomerase family protein [Streptosporangiaceae bacterium]